jgi:hypothetical protein
MTHYPGGAIVAEIDYERNAKYFESVSYKGGIALGVIGFILLLTGKSGAVLVGLLFAGLGAFLIYRQVAGRPTDGDIDRQVRTVLEELPQRALKKLALDADEVKLIDPIIVGGHPLGSRGSGFRVKIGKDGKFRSSIFEGIAIFFAEQELHAYKYQVSLVKKNESSDRTDVYFYRDVVSVSTRSDSTSALVVGKANPQTLNTEVFTLTTSGGTAVECSMDASDDIVGRNIQGARQLVRNKKMHTPYS